MKITSKQIEHALRETGGNISEVAAALGVHRSTLYRRIEKNQTLQDALEDAREELFDIAHSGLRHLALKRHFGAIAYIMNNSPEAKSRGWGPRQEITGKDGGALIFKIDRVDARPDPDA